MAWDANSSPWDWETDGVIVPNHVAGMDSRKLPLASWPCETELSHIKHDGHFSQSSRALCSSEVRLQAASSQSAQVDVTRNGSLLSNRVVTPAMANIHGTLVFDDAASHGSVGPILQARVPIVTTCIASGAFIAGSDHGNGSLESVVQKRFDERQGSAERKTIQGLGAHENWGNADRKAKMGIQQASYAEEKLCLIANSHARDNLAAPKHLSDKSIGSICNGDKGNVIDEQHSSSARGPAGSGDSLTGLQLGKRTYPLDVAPPAAVKATPKFNAVGKKARGGAAPAQVPRCQVEGCKLDLSSSKDYHRRHKVCEPHSKAGKVVVASLEQRFCQQCSRFHILTEFDETKRSCRRRLAGHNKRRRKPQPDPLELQARLRSSFEDWPFFYQSRYPRLPFWQDAGGSQSNILWPRKLMQYYDQPNFDYSSQTIGTDMFTKGLSSSLTRDKFPLLLLQSPKTLMSMSSCDPRVQDYLPELVGGSTMGNGLSLASSSIGAGAYTGFENTPVTEVTRVSDSGRALSLLSLHSQCSQASDMVSLDLSGLANSAIDHNQHMQEANVSSQQFLFQGQHPYCQDFSTTLCMASNLHCPNAADVHHEEAHVMTSEKDFFECSFLNNLHQHSGYEGTHHHPLNMQMQGHDTTAQANAKQTQDLMQLASFQVPNAHSQSSSTVFNLESSALGDSHFSAETSFLKY